MKKKEHNLRIAKNLQRIAKSLHSQAVSAKAMGMKELPIEPAKLEQATEPLVELSTFLIQNIEAEDDEKDEGE